MPPSASLRATSTPAWALLNLRQGEAPAAVEEQSLDQVRTLDRVLLSVEKRAFRIARIAARDDDCALDIVQDAMLQLARRYAQRPAEEWRPLSNSVKTQLPRAVHTPIALILIRAGDEATAPHPESAELLLDVVVIGADGDNFDD